METLYQYLWKHMMLGRKLTTSDGREVEILSPGRHNQDAGPDFSCARLLLDGHEWVGNVEVHVRASDWYRHGHDRDAAYDNVILHFVAESDRPALRRDGTPLPEVRAVFPESFRAMYARLAEKIGEIRCRGLLADLPQLTVTDWMSSLAVERMQQKARRVAETCRNTGGDWERACFITLARALGFGLNSEPFEMLARSLPLTTAMHHSDNILQIEALLFGQAGMLEMSDNIFDEYYQTLCREYYFLARKYGLRPMRRELWKYAKTRPQNFPHRRIALLAETLRSGFQMLSRLVEAASDREAIRALLRWRLGGYWLTHSGFGLECKSAPEALSASSVTLLIINFAAPVLYAYGAARGDADLAERGLDLWFALPAENNSIVRGLTCEGIPCSCAADSQALIQLRKEYCEADRCLDCRFGHALLRSSAMPQTRTARTTV